MGEGIYSKTFIKVDSLDGLTHITATLNII